MTQAERTKELASLYQEITGKPLSMLSIDDFLSLYDKAASTTTISDPAQDQITVKNDEKMDEARLQEPIRNREIEGKRDAPVKQVIKEGVNHTISIPESAPLFMESEDDIEENVESAIDIMRRMAG